MMAVIRMEGIIRFDKVIPKAQKNPFQNKRFGLNFPDGLTTALKHGKKKLRLLELEAGVAQR